MPFAHKGLNRGDVICAQRARWRPIGIDRHSKDPCSHRSRKVCEGCDFDISRIDGGEELLRERIQGIGIIAKKVSRARQRIHDARADLSFHLDEKPASANSRESIVLVMGIVPVTKTEIVTCLHRRRAIDTK